MDLNALHSDQNNQVTQVQTHGEKNQMRIAVNMATTQQHIRAAQILCSDPIIKLGLFVK